MDEDNPVTQNVMLIVSSIALQLGRSA